MTSRPGNSAVSSEDLRSSLEKELCRHLGETVEIVRLERRPASRRSSYALDELDLTLANGTRFQLVFKDLSQSSMLAEGRRAKPAFLYDPLREIQVYHRLLAPGALGTPTCFGTVVDAARKRCWLFLERVEGVELGHIGDFQAWQEAASWLAGFHGRFQPGSRLADLAESVPLLGYDSDYYRLWRNRAGLFHSRASRPLTRGTRRQLARLITHYDRVVERLTSLPVTVIHGEFYAANVLVRDKPCEGRICPVDWEMAALGPGLIDLAALSAGSWTEEQRRALAEVYYAALAPGSWPEIGALLDALDYCRLHLAVQWLGWSDVWSPPPERAHDWLSEAFFLMEKIGL